MLLLLEWDLVPNRSQTHTAALHGGFLTTGPLGQLEKMFFKEKDKSKHRNILK